MDKKRPSDICFIKFKEARTFLLFYLDLNANYYGKLALVAVSVVISCHETTEFHIYETLLSHITKKTQNLQDKAMSVTWYFSS